MNWPVLPADYHDNNNDSANVVAAADEWQMVYLTADADENVAKLNALTRDDKRVKIIMQADWTCEGFNYGANDVTVDGLYWIWDLNGYTLNLDGTMTTFADQFEITDSSAAGTGCINERNIFSIFKFTGVHVIVSGGTINCREFRVWTYRSSSRRLTISGGKINARERVKIDYDATVASTSDGNAYLDVQGGLICAGDGIVYEGAVSHTAISDNAAVVKNAAGNIIITGNKLLVLLVQWDQQYEDYYYALSKTDQVSGAYNYVYGVLWEVTVEQLADLDLADDQTYYLWYRSATGWYSYTGLTTTV